MTPHLNTALSTDQRVRELLAAMTLDEKLAQLTGVWAHALVEIDRSFSASKTAEAIPYGTGHVTRIAAVTLLPPSESAALANKIQRYLVEQTRLGIPAIVHEESCAGYMANGATTFPQAIGIAATWQPELVEEMAEIIRHQMRAVGAHHALAPVLDINRDPRWGRVEETFGEDPFLITSIGTAYIRGLQGDDLTQGIAATAKHFIGYGMSEGGMNWAPAHISERDLRETHLMPFRAAIQEAGVASVMNAYQELDGIPLGSSKKMMVDLLRGELGFNGVVVSDYFTVDMLHSYHKVAANKSEAARFGIEAGIDVELPDRNCYGDPLREALDAGAIDMGLIDESVSRILAMKVDLGLFENPYVDEGKAVSVYGLAEQTALSRKLAQNSIVLLKNDGALLPLSPSLKSVALIGPIADSIRLLQGDYHYPSHMESVFTHAKSALAAPNPVQRHLEEDINDHFPPSTSVLAGIQSVGVEINYAQGCDITEPNTDGFAEAIAAAQKSEVAIVVVGDKSGLAPGATVGESIDSATLQLPGSQQALVEAVVATGVPTVVVLVTGRPYAIAWIDEHVPAVVEAWLPAQEGGHAIAEVLFGEVNPGGKLPVSFPRSVGQVPVYYNHKPSGGRSHWWGDYADLTSKPLYPFGHGLSYTEFTYSDLTISQAEVSAQDSVTISVTVQNTGAVAGDEVVQLYLSDPVASVTRPVKALKGFQRLSLQPQEKKTVVFDLPVRHTAFYNREMVYAVEAGEIGVLVGSSSEDIRQTGQFQIVGESTPVEPVHFTQTKVENA